ncbi:MAG: peptidase E [Clostridiales bacterium]|nr:peptidase E [Clostridiales bacterium]MBE5747321.1 peptidase E [Clostridiales bacterium]
MKKIIAIGGGELRERTTMKIDEYIAKLAKEHAGENRANALFIPTASHDYMPYYNTFHKVYTGVFNIKTDVALTVFKEPDMEKMRAKFEKADMIYVGGGDTVFMIEHWKQSGLLPLIKEAYERGVIIAGLSAGAICWFSDIYTDSTAALGEGDKYAMFEGLNWIKGKISPHYNARMLDFDKIVCYNLGCAYGIEDDAALVIEDGEIVGSVSSGGKAWWIEQVNGAIQKKEIALL